MVDILKLKISEPALKIQFHSVFFAHMLITTQMPSVPNLVKLASHFVRGVAGSVVGLLLQQ